MFITQKFWRYLRIWVNVKIEIDLNLIYVLKSGYVSWNAETVSTSWYVQKLNQVSSKTDSHTLYWNNKNILQVSLRYFQDIL